MPEPPPGARFEDAADWSSEGSIEEGERVTRKQTTPRHWREVAAVVATIVLADLTIYSGAGFTGLAAFFVVAIGLMTFGLHRPRIGRWALVLAVAVLALAAGLVWSGTPGQVLVGGLLLAAFVSAASGTPPQVLSTLAQISLAFFGGLEGAVHYGQGTSRRGLPRFPMLAIGLPAVTLVAFTLIFVAANPDLLSLLSENLARIFEPLQRWLMNVDFRQVGFWMMTGLLTLGLLRPLVLVRGRSDTLEELDPGASIDEPRQNELFRAYRNTLLCVIALFSVYLVFEFATLWFREFEPGFYYAGYAHQGAAWLTVALALATFTLSAIFNRDFQARPESARLRKLAWIWSAQNFLLGLAVYNRLVIYIDFNGLTRLRTVALFGITAVVIGFVWVLCKIVKRESFEWLVRRQLWTVVFVTWAFALTPVPRIVSRYNVDRVLAGELKPSVQIISHPIEPEGLPPLLELLELDDEILREGVRALLCRDGRELELLQQRRAELGWRARQLADERALADLLGRAGEWRERFSPEEEARRIDEFWHATRPWY